VVEPCIFYSETLCLKQPKSSSFRNLHLSTPTRTMSPANADGFFLPKILGSKHLEYPLFYSVHLNPVIFILHPSSLQRGGRGIPVMEPVFFTEGTRL